MTVRSKLLLLALCAPALAAQAADGLAVPESAWQRWHARAAVGTYDLSTRLAVASLVGDYYFRGLRLGDTGTTGGFRATSGLMVGAGSAILGAAGVPGHLGNSLSVGHIAVPSLLAGSDPGDAGSTLPYLGLGYTSIRAGSGFSFSADLGIVAQSPAGSPTLGRALFGTQSLDAAVRNLRFTPVIQLGVRYTF